MPGARVELNRALLAVAVAQRYSTHHLAVKGAFLHASRLQKDRIYMGLPKIHDVLSADGQIIQ